ncbi:MAG: hypothetical protein ACFFCD_18020, partial [Promethearchaeota archaeon]
MTVILSLAYLIATQLRSKNIFSKKILISPKLAKAIVILLCCASGTAWLVLHTMLPTFFLYLTYYSGVYPWYFYPFRFGIAFIFMLAALIFIVFKREHNDYDFSFFISTLAVLFIVGKIISYINIYVPPTIIQTGYYERRILEIMFLPISILAGFAVAKIASRKPHAIHGIGMKRFLSISALVFVLVIFSFSSLLSVENFSLRAHPWVGSTVSSVPDPELEGLNFIKDNASPNSYVLTYSSQSRQTLCLAGVRVPYTTRDWLNQFFLSSEPSTFFVSVSNLKSIAPTDYVYLNSRDLNSIPSSGFFNSHLSNYLPIAFQNNETLVYNLPDFTPPTSSNFTIVYPNSQNVSDTLYLPLDALALGSYEYDLQLFGDPNLFNNSNILLPQDIITHKPVDEGSPNFWNSFAAGSSGAIGTPTIALDTLKAPSGMESSMIVIPSGMASIAGVFHSFDTPQDWSSFNFLLLNIYGQSTMQDIYIYLHAPSVNNEFQFQVTEDWNGWKQLALAFKNVKTLGSPDLTEVDSIYIFKDTPGTLHVDQLTLENGFGNQFVYENWVENGGTLIIFNSKGHGDFAKKLSIYSNGQVLADGVLNQNGESFQMPASVNIATSSSKDENVSILANYTLNGEPVGPYAYTKNLGRGKIIYVEVNSLFS